jgi:hypothetical protein
LYRNIRTHNKQRYSSNQRGNASIWSLRVARRTRAYGRGWGRREQGQNVLAIAHSHFGGYSFEARDDTDINLVVLSIYLLR